MVHSRIQTDKPRSRETCNQMLTSNQPRICNPTYPKAGKPSTVATTESTHVPRPANPKPRRRRRRAAVRRAPTRRAGEAPLADQGGVRGVERRGRRRARKARRACRIGRRRRTGAARVVAGRVPDGEAAEAKRERRHAGDGGRRRAQELGASVLDTDAHLRTHFTRSYSEVERRQGSRLWRHRSSRRGRYRSWGGRDGSGGLTTNDGELGRGLRGELFILVLRLLLIILLVLVARRFCLRAIRVHTRVAR